MQQNPYDPPASVDDVGTHSFRIGSLWGKHFPKSSIALCAVPVFNYLFVCAHWIVASAMVGEPARQGMIGPDKVLLGIPYVIGIGLMLLSIAVAPAVVFVGNRRNSVVQHIVAYGACFAASVILFRLDIMHMTTWIAD